MKFFALLFSVLKFGLRRFWGFFFLVQFSVVYGVCSWFSYIKHFSSSQPYYLVYKIFVSPRVVLTQSFILVFHHGLTVLVSGWLSYCGVSEFLSIGHRVLGIHVFFLFLLTYFSLLLHFNLRRHFKKDYESLSHVFTITLGLFQIQNHFPSELLRHYSFSPCC